LSVCDETRYPRAMRVRRRRCPETRNAGKEGAIADDCSGLKAGRAHVAARYALADDKLGRNLRVRPPLGHLREQRVQPKLEFAREPLLNVATC
jgi:hypothetical protein